MYAIGRLYERGLGVPINIDLATKWYAKAAAFGEPEAKVRLEILSEQQHQ
jgi:TPR repeat protein